MDSQSTKLLWNLRVALLKAMAESREMRDVLDRLREHGWSAYVVIDGAEDEDDEPGMSSEVFAAAPPDGQMELDLDGSDRAFLRSLGIDPRNDPGGS